MTMPRLESNRVPQADRLLRVVHLVRAMATGREPALDPRDRAYYRQAARILGLLDAGDAPTPRGQELIHAEDPRADLRSAFMRSEIGQAWMRFDEAEHLGDLDPESAEPFLRSCTPLSDATITRRARTLRSWLGELTDEPQQPTPAAPANPLETLCETRLTPDELELAELLLEALKEGDEAYQVMALADVVLAALVRLEAPLRRARDVVTWLNRQTPPEWHYTVSDELLGKAVSSLENQDYRVLQARLGPVGPVTHPTLVVEYAPDAEAEDAGALRELLQEFAASAPGALPEPEVTHQGYRSRVTVVWPQVSTAPRPTAPVRVQWLRRPRRPYVLPLVTHGDNTHITTLHHVAALAFSVGEIERLELLTTDGVLARWSDQPVDGYEEAYLRSPGVLVDTPEAPDDRPHLWWSIEDEASSAPAPDPEAVVAALTAEPTGGPALTTALRAYATDLPPLEFGPPAPHTTYETSPPDTGHLVLAPTGSALRISIPEAPSPEVRRDLVLHALGHILLGHIRPDSRTAFWDTAATIRRGPDMRPLDRAVQETFADWFPTATARKDRTPEPPKPKPEPAPTNETFLLTLRAFLAREPWHIDPYAGLRRADVDPLPHQVRAVYHHLLPRRPLRMMLADDPGAGKTIMAGLLIQERRSRGTLDRCLVVAPGNLVDQWQGELEDRFGLEFLQLDTSDPSTFRGEDRLLLARLDQLARNDRLLAELRRAPPWDLVVVDEAHKMSAKLRGRTVVRTDRYRLGELLRERTDDLLLMTATPHNGIEGCFQLSLALLDRDRFCGPYQEPFPEQDTSDVLLRRVKEDLVTFHGNKLFPERFANTVAFDMEPAEDALYEALTSYVRHEMNRASAAGKQTANRVGFAMQVLQRRLASSPRAIHISLKRRRERLERDLARKKLDQKMRALDHLDDLSSRELERVEDEFASSASAARTEADLRREIEAVVELERMARDLLNQNIDSKWHTLRELLDQPPIHQGSQREKLVVFTESRDTLNHLVEKLQNHFGRHEAIIEIHGDTSRKQRRQAVEAFMTDDTVKVLVANDAAGEGVNLQGAHFLVNYDLPWNPNRLEQRFGRIHRIGQEHTCQFWNLLARGTREGDVYIRLLEKLEVERKALGGRVYDVLGELFEDRPLSDILKSATLADAADTSEVEQRLSEDSVKRVLDRGAALVTQREGDPASLEARLEATHAGNFLQPDAIVPELLDRLGGRMRRRGGHSRAHRVPLSVRRIRDRSGHRLPPRFDRLPHPLPRRHPLVRSTLEAFVEEHRDLLDRTAVLAVDQDLSQPVPAMLLEVTRQGAHRERQLQLVAWTPDGLLDLAAHAPGLSPSASTDPLLDDAFDAAHQAIQAALTEQVLEIHEARIPELQRRRQATETRLERAIEAQEAHVDHLEERDQDASQARERLQDLQQRLADAHTRFERLREPPTVMVEALAQFTLVPTDDRHEARTPPSKSTTETPL